MQLDADALIDAFLAVEFLALVTELRTLRLRQKTNFPRRFKLMLPVQSCPKKYFALSKPQLSGI
jgi:hypothetical protein